MMKKFLLALLSVVFLATGCTKYDNPQPHFEEYEQEQGDGTVQRKVLVISIDGLVGAELRKDVPPALADLIKNGKYSFDALTDERTTTPVSWATLMTGVGYSRHNISSETYLPSPNEEDPHASEKFFPSVFYLVREQNAKLFGVSVVQDNELANVLLMDARESAIAANDEEVKNTVLEKLKAPQVDLLVAQFTSVSAAGIASGFSLDEPAYKAAVQQVDGYIAEIRNALEAREEYEFEDWLVIVTSTYGGIGNAHGGDSAAERNTFAIYYNKAFKEQELVPDRIISPRFFGYDNQPSYMRARNAAASVEEDAYNISKTKALTIEAKMKVNKNNSGNYGYSWPPFLSKVNARTGNTAGWSFFRSGDNVNFFIGDGAAKIEVGGGPVGVNEEWTHITGTFEVINGAATGKFYVNGVLVGTASESLNVDNIKSSSPLTMGFQPEVFSEAYLDFHMADVHIWDVALTEREVTENANRMGVPADHPKINHLKGYWALDDGGDMFQNLVEGMPNIPLSGNIQYKVFGNNLPYVDPFKTISLKNQDVVAQILYWLEVEQKDTWELEGDEFLKKFEIEFIK
ncbi:MAG TPA: LamG-like jellyroll fold domain-containing protein [Sphingobacterium sp.]|nr:LamG-like jellyroll fold domain-containing protein [Sphingobacterium sp.]